MQIFCCSISSCKVAERVVMAGGINIAAYMLHTLKA